MSDGDAATPEPQQVQFQTQAASGGSHDFGHDWVQYALNTEVPSFVGGVDHSLNPSVDGPGAEGGTALA